MAIQNKTKKELISEIKELQGEFYYLNKIKDLDTARRIHLEQELAIALQKIAFQNIEKEKRAAELIIASLELTFQTKEKAKRANELVIANIELVFQNKEKEKRAAELIIANKELAFQNEEKEKRANELALANTELAFLNAEKEKRAAELIVANKELAYQNELKEKRAINLVITNKELQLLIQLNKDKDKFFSIITHDLKNPFVSIIGYCELLTEQIKKMNCEKIQEFANIILQSSNRAMDLLMSLMVWAQSQSGRMVFNPESFNIITLIDEVTLLLDGIAKQKSILIESSLPSNIQVNADKEMISAVLRNLISNAIKFTPHEGKIMISVDVKQNELTVSVSDTGVGISKERIEKLFKISDINSTPGTEKETGTGLGLILCKEFINKNNGKIWLESEAGIGTTFCFSLPIIEKNRQIVVKGNIKNT
jgi:signal transduction histidine kinase